METPTVRVLDLSSIKKRRRNSSSSESSSSTIKGCSSERKPPRNPSVSFAQPLKKERFIKEKKRSKLTDTRVDLEHQRDTGSTDTGTPTADSAPPIDSEVCESIACHVFYVWIHVYIFLRTRQNSLNKVCCHLMNFHLQTIRRPSKHGHS